MRSPYNYYVTDREGAEWSQFVPCHSLCTPMKDIIREYELLMPKQFIIVFPNGVIYDTFAKFGNSQYRNALKRNTLARGKRTYNLLEKYHEKNT